MLKFLRVFGASVALLLSIYGITTNKFEYLPVIYILLGIVWFISELEEKEKKLSRFNDFTVSIVWLGIAALYFMI